MSIHEVTKPIIFIVGPTASGKTTLAVQLAKKFDSEIISADSRYFYKRMNIGTAKPNLNEMAGVKHHMIDIVDPDETLSVAVFKKIVENVIESVHEQNQIPIVVGGTGQYIHAILNNWTMPEIEADYDLRNYLETFSEKYGKEKLYAFLEKIDPEAAKFIDYQNLRRSIRAIEVILKTGQKFSDLRKSEKSLYSRKIIGIHWDREELYKRIDQRIDEMIKNGFIEEVEELINSGYSIHTPSMSAIGYREIIFYLRGKCTLAEAITLMRRNSRQYVRRQANWFKENDPTIKWFKGGQLDLSTIVDYISFNEGWLAPK
ncbi:MAG TPA: tRNA (adenosine(37)-N6)-dimethylallyltransferase MiaA [Anaerolineaceae bacterium]|nr:tRNA (adenosine(37)-N6)-dimethylallyltransferase MiaA [Anaerolineaceae bacterium]